MCLSECRSHTQYSNRTLKHVYVLLLAELELLVDPSARTLHLLRHVHEDERVERVDEREAHAKRVRGCARQRRKLVAAERVALVGGVGE